MELRKKKTRILSIMITFLLALTLLPTGVHNENTYSYADTPSLTVEDLTVEYVEAPQGIDVAAPRFGWKIDSNGIGAVQTAYKIKVAEADGGAVAWDSGSVSSSNSIAVKYAGSNALKPETDYDFTVTAYDNSGNSASASSKFSTGVDGWDNARWISPGETNYAVSMLRTEKPIDDTKTVKSAKLYMTALGAYKAYINGKLVQGERESAFDPGWVNYIDYVKYQTFDVTDYIVGDTVALSAELGRGWYKSSISGTANGNNYNNLFTADSSPAAPARALALLGKLVVQYSDGTKDIVVTDGDWKYNNDGPIYNHDFYSNGNFNPDASPFTDGVAWGGEKYDANKEVAGWNRVGFNDSGAAWSLVRTGTYNRRVESGNDSARAYYNEERLQFPQNDSYLFSDINTSVGGLDYGEVIKDNYVIFNADGSVKDGDGTRPANTLTVMPGQRLIVNLGQNIAGVLETAMEASSGTEVVFSHVEMLNDGRLNPNASSGGSQAAGGLTGAAANKYRAKGTIYTANLRGEKTARYTFGSRNQVVYRPDFTFFGFQYVQITATKPLTISKIVGIPITSAMKQTGNIETNVQPLNKLFNNVLWSQMDNFLSIPTDCPQRNERCGWTGDIMLFSGTGVFNFEAAAFLQNYVEICDDQAARNQNRYTAIMPAQQSYGTGVNSGWSDVGIILPWTLWQQTGDLSIIAKSYDQMDRYMDAIGTNGQGYATNNYGDWVALQACSLQYLNLVFRAYDAQLMAQMATALGRQSDVTKYERIFADTKAFYMANYISKGTDGDGLTDGDIKSAYAINATTGVGTNQDGRASNNGGTYVNNSQTAISWALKLGFYRDEAHKQYILSKLLESIKNEGGSVRPGYEEDTLAVGFLGLNTILPSLSGAGATDYAFKLLQQDAFPSWLYSVKSGATSIWERWNSYSIDDSFLAPSMNSFNHFSFGACVEWMYQEMAGIGRDLDNPGFKHFNLQPTLDPTNGITKVSASYDSYYGMIKSAWEATNKGVLTDYSATVPANTTATLYLPVSDVKRVSTVNGAAYLGQQIHNGLETAAFSLKSGGYKIAVNDGKIALTLESGYVASSLANKDALSSLVNLLTGKLADLTADKDKFVTGAWNAFAEAMLNASVLNTNPAATQNEVDAAYVSLSNAFAALKYKAGDDAVGILKTIVDKESARKETDYTPSTWSVFAASLEAAKAALNNRGSYSNEDFISFANDVLNAANALARHAVNKNMLVLVMDEANRLLGESEKYAPSSVKALEDALSAAETVYDNAAATSAEVTAAIEDLLTAIINIYEKADTTALAWLVSLFDTVTNDNYTTATWNAFKGALSDAKAVLANGDASQNAVSAAFDALSNAYSALTRESDVSALTSAVAYADKIIASGSSYITDTILGIPAALSAAKAVLAKGNASQEEVDAAANALTKEIFKARLKANVNHLSALIAAIGAVDLSGYTVDSVRVLNAAVTDARAIVNDENATQSDADIAAARVTNALAALVKASVPPVTPPTQQTPDPAGKISMAAASVTTKLAQATYAYSGTQVKPVVSVEYSGKALSASSDFTVSYGANVNIGKGTATITGKGKYSGTKTISFNIVPTKTALSKATAGKKLAKVAWKKVSAAQGVTGYQIQYKQKGTSKWKTKTVKASKKAALTIKKLKKNKKYQFQVRAYKTVSGVSYYAEWSTVRTSKKIK